MQAFMNFQKNYPLLLMTRIVSPSAFSVSFDSVAPAPSPFGPTFACSTSRLPRRSVVVKPSGSAFKNTDFHFPVERFISRNER
jgi:hypothetical protein